jgi:hypothetical protein
MQITVKLNRSLARDIPTLFDGFSVSPIFTMPTLFDGFSATSYMHVSLLTLYVIIGLRNFKHFLMTQKKVHEPNHAPLVFYHNPWGVYITSLLLQSIQGCC